MNNGVILPETNMTVYVSFIWTLITLIKIYCSTNFILYNLITDWQRVQHTHYRIKVYKTQNNSYMKIVFKWRSRIPSQTNLYC